MPKILALLFYSLLLICSTSFASPQKEQFLINYPERCFEVTHKNKPTDQTSRCRISRLNFYSEYYAKNSQYFYGRPFSKIYAMIRMRQSIENNWDLDSSNTLGSR
ncbi:MAG: hypothetical protein AAF203_00125 [Pseudomonadota bacterium]